MNSSRTEPGRRQERARDSRQPLLARREARCKAMSRRRQSDQQGSAGGGGPVRLDGGQRKRTRLRLGSQLPSAEPSFERVLLRAAPSATMDAKCSLGCMVFGVRFMSRATLEQRVAALEREVGSLLADRAETRHVKDWRRTRGAFTGDAFMKMVFEEGRKIRDAERKQAQTRNRKKR